MSTALHKSLASSLRKGAGGNGTPTAEQVGAINAYTLREHSADELYVREFVVCHNGIDRDRECIDEGLLAKFVTSLPGKGLFIKHPMSWDGDSGPGEGRWFAARIERMSLADARTLLREPQFALPPGINEAQVLMASAYMVRTDDTKDLIAKLDAGIAGDVSIGFTTAGRADVIDPVTGTRIAERLLGPGEALEASLVWLGAQPGARAVKQLNTHPQGNAMDPAQLAALKAALGPHALLLDNPTQLKAVLDSHDTNKAAATSLAALKTALGDQSALLDNPAALKAAVDAGTAYKTTLVDEIVAADRIAGACADTPEAVAAHKAAHEALPVSVLKSLAAARTKATGTPQGQLGGGDPNAQKGALPNNNNTLDVPADIAFLG